MIELMEAIQIAFQGITATFADGCYFGDAPDNAALPLCRATPISHTPDYNTQDEYGDIPYTETAVLQFDVYAPTDKEALEGFDDVDGLFNYRFLDNVDDEYATEVFISGRRVSGPIPMTEPQDIFRVFAQYEFKVQRLIVRD